MTETRLPSLSSTHTAVYGFRAGPRLLAPAVKVAGSVLRLTPREGAPEKTSGREGYIHPIAIKGNCSETEVTLLIRDF